MFLPSSYMAGIDDGAPTPCKPFTLSSNVCVGDLVVIIACSIAGLGFVFWSFHAIRKMRTQFPFTYKPADDKVQPTDQHDGPDPFPIPSSMDDSLVRRGIAQTPSLPQRVRTRTALTGPDECFYKPTGLAPISSDVYDAQDPETAPRVPPRAGGRSHRASGSLSRSGPYGGGYRHECEPSGEEYVSPSRAKGSPGRMPVSGGDYYLSRQSMSA